MLTAEIFTNCLEYLYPCTGLIQVGAGNGSALAGERFDRIPHLLAIEADDLAFSYLANNFQNRPGWTALKALISDEESESIFYVATNPNESGLLDPEALKAVWRNLGCLETRAQAATTLSTVMQHEKHAEAYNWLCVDCLPAIRILHGLEKQLEQFDVIDLRVLDRSAGILDQGCAKSETDALLESLGYQAAFVEECTNPNLLRVLYVRDGNGRLEIQTDRLRQQYGFEIEQLNQDNEQLKQGKAQLEKDKLGLVAARDEQASRVQQLTQEVEQLKQGKAQLEKDKAGLAAARDGQASMAQQLRQEVEQLKQGKAQLEKDKAGLVAARDGQASRVQQLTQEVEQLKQGEAQLEKDKAGLVAGRDEQTSREQQLTQEVQQLRQGKVQLEKDKASAVAALDEQSKRAQQLATEVEQIKREKAQIEQEKLAIQKEKDGQSNLLTQHANQFNDLNCKYKKELGNSAELAKRQQFLEEELLRAVAQIDLIKEMMRETGL